jgi:hypothetical protein
VDIFSGRVRKEVAIAAASDEELNSDIRVTPEIHAEGLELVA